MGSDRARVSYDEGRRYRSVVMQQGRVTLEADWNEAQLIATEEERREALDFVGPVGTPDDGYRILNSGKNFDIEIGPGTLYVGGLRTEFDSKVSYVAQDDWLDHTTDPDWVDPASLGEAPGREWIGLLLREQEVSAVEDTALREVALGGPDTAQRTRLLQHVVRVATDARDCPGGLRSAMARWAKEGLSPDPDSASMRLKSKTTLEVSFPPVTAPPDPCEPQPVGGYLGADNQLIRVQVASVDANGTARLVWGYDNASFLYRVTVLDAANVRLQSVPPDASRQPRAGQAVEVLRAAAKLAGTDYVAALTGAVFTLAEPYDPDGGVVALPAPGLDAVWLDPNATPAVFLRVWEEVKTITPGQPIRLGATGIQVTLQAADGIFHVGDYWHFAVRPSTATAIYPQRYLDGAQPPDGPRLWYCPLAVVAWNDGVLSVLDDCRKPFDDLVTLTRTRFGGCCTVTVSPDQFTGGATLQSVLDRYRNRDRVTVCLMPGRYKLDQPLRLGREHSNLTIEACHDGAVLEAADDAAVKFLDGLVVLDHADCVTLRGLRFHLPQVPFRAAGGKLVGLDPTRARRIQRAILANLMVSVGVRAVHCALLAVENCLFRFSLTEDKDVLGIGLFGCSECWGLRLTGNRFLHEENYLRSTDRLFRFLAGYVLAPGAAPPARDMPGAGVTLARTVLNDAVIEGNLFEGLTFALFAMAEFGAVRACANKVRDCDAGLWFMSLRLLAQIQQLDKVLVAEAVLAPGRTLASHLHALIATPIVELGIALAISYPLPTGVALRHAGSQTTAAQAQAEAAAAMQRVFDRVLPVLTGEPQAEAAVAVHEGPVGSARKTPAATLQEHVLTIARATVAASDLEPLTMSMTVSDNAIDTIVAQASGAAGLVIADDERDTPSTLVMSGNTVLCFSPNMPAAMVVLLDACTVTGNIVGNQAAVRARGQTYSLVLAPLPQGRDTAAVAVTGNVFGGAPLLPARPVTVLPTPPPMNTWLFLNTVV